MRYLFHESVPFCEAYESQINLDLFNATVQLAVSTTEDPKLVPEVQRCLKGLPWYEQVNCVTYFEPYGIRYMGELLERYAEKMGNEPTNTRAIALAMAFVAPLLTPNMFVGRQRKTFMSALSKQCKKDLYILSACCRLASEDEQDAWTEKLLAYPCKRTEEAVFLLCTTDASTAEFDELFPRVEDLFGRGRTLPVINNAGIYSWLLSCRADVIKVSRGKRFATIKALFALAKGYVRENHAAHNTLLNAGYSAQEILYLNSLFLWTGNLGQYHIASDSIPAERMASAFVLSILNDPNGADDDVLEYVSWLFSLYHRFRIKYEGYENLLEAVSPSLNITCPATLIWVVQKMKWDLNYPFDVLDRKWDVLAKELPLKEYHELFRKQLLRLEQPTKERLLPMIARYRELTGREYLELFEKYQYEEKDVFSRLVDAGIIDLWTFFDRHKEDVGDTWSSSCLAYVWDKACAVKSRQAFEFWKCFFEHYSMQDFQNYFLHRRFHEAFLDRSGYYNSTRVLRYKRDFLTREENRLLYEWIDSSVFVYEPDIYVSLINSFLRAPETVELFDTSEQRSAFDVLLARDRDGVYLRDLKLRFLSQEELDAEKKEKEAAKAAREQREAEEDNREVCKEMDEKFDGTISSISKYLSHFYYAHRKKQFACAHATVLLVGILEKQRSFSRVEYGELLSVIGELVKYDGLNPDEIIRTLSALSIVEE